MSGLNENYFAAVAEASPDVMRILELDGTVEFMNAHGLRLLEIEAFAQNHRKLWTDLWPEQSRPAMRTALELAREGGVGRFRAYCPTAKGRPRWWDTVVSPIRDEVGEVVRLLAMSRDVSDEVRRDRRLRDAVGRVRRANAEKARSLNYLKAALDGMPAGLAFYDADDRLVIWNSEYAAAGGAEGDASPLRTGMPYRQLLEHDLLQGRHPDAVGREADWLEARLSARSSGDGSRIQKLANGRWYRFEDRRLADGGLIAVAVDITALKAREFDLAARTEELADAKAAAEAASEAKSAFLANMSHEIRTPLNGVLAMADMLCKASLPSREKELAEVVRGCADTLAHLLEDILDLARVESGALTIASAPFDLRSAIENVVAVAGLKASEKGLSLTMDVGPDLERSVMGDVTRFKQIAHNLVSNAVKFTDTGAVRVTLTRQPGSRLRLLVSDTGIGFGPEVRDRLFRRFEQADDTITRRFGGTGLGLAISSQLAGLMGGELNCQSVPGEGSSFWLDLPLVLTQPVGSVETDEVIVAPASNDRPLKILVADDNPTNRRVVQLILEEAGAEVICVEDGSLAVEAARRETFDLILMDIQMPVLDGFSAVREIRAHERAVTLSRVPTLMLSANAMPEHIAAGQAAGSDGHVSKPITAAGLFSAIQTVLEQSASGPLANDDTRAVG